MLCLPALFSWFYGRLIVPLIPMFHPHLAIEISIFVFVNISIWQEGQASISRFFFLNNTNVCLCSDFYLPFQTELMRLPRNLHMRIAFWKWRTGKHLFSDKTKGFAFLITYLCKRAHNNGGWGRGGWWIGLCYIEICIKIKSLQWGKNTILGCNRLLQHTRQEKLLNSLIMFDDCIISLVSHCSRLDLIKHAHAWSLIIFFPLFFSTIVKEAAWNVASNVISLFVAFAMCTIISIFLTPLVLLNCGSFSLW